MNGDKHRRLMVYGSAEALKNVEECRDLLARLEFTSDGVGEKYKETILHDIRKALGEASKWLWAMGEID